MAIAASGWAMSKQETEVPASTHTEPHPVENGTRYFGALDPLDLSRMASLESCECRVQLRVQPSDDDLAPRLTTKSSFHGSIEESGSRRTAKFSICRARLTLHSDLKNRA